jgi:hypothetical protein
MKTFIEATITVDEKIVTLTIEKQAGMLAVPTECNDIHLQTAAIVELRSDMVYLKGTTNDHQAKRKFQTNEHATTYARKLKTALEVLNAKYSMGLIKTNPFLNF